MNKNFQTFWVYMRVTSDKGSVTKTQHLVYDADKFFETRRSEAAKIGAEKGSVMKVEQITHAQFKA